MWATPLDVRSGSCRTDDRNGTTIDPQNVYHAAFSAVGRLMAMPFRLLGQNQKKPDPVPNRRMKRTETMSKTVNRPLPQWAQTMRDSVVMPVVIWYQRQRMIEELNGLSDRVLADIGLTRATIRDAAKSAYRPTRESASVPTTVALRAAAETRPAASNDQAKHSLAA